MLRFLCRFVGVWVLAAALIFAVVDGAKSIAASEVVTTPLAVSWAMLAEVGVEDAEPVTAEQFSPPWPLDAAAAGLLAAPTAAVLLVVAVVLLVVGRRRRPPKLSREFAI